jgi:flagella basal body P-ring formation protein FlgA
MNGTKCDHYRSVGILTRPTAERRFSGAWRTFALLLGAGCSATAAAGQGGNSHPVTEITKAAEDFLEHRISQTDRQITPRAGQLDPRLTLARCDQPLEGFLGAGTEIGSRTIVGVRCSGSSPWKVYVPVDLVEMRPVLVARQALPRGHLLTANDLVLEDRDVSRINAGFVTIPGDVVGHRLKRQLVSGSVLSPLMLETQLVVKRGQSVTLVVQNDALNIRMAGTALMDGAIDQRIRVENTVSRRVVEGFVRSPEYVEVLVR